MASTLSFRFAVQISLFLGLLIGLGACRPQPQPLAEAPVITPSACPGIDTLRKQAFAAYDEGNFAQAERLQRQAADLVLVQGCDLLHWVKARCNMANALSKNDPRKSLAQAQDTLLTDLERIETGQADLAGMMHFWIATFYLRQSDFYRARPHLEQARAAHELHRIPVTSRAGNNLYKHLANIYTRLGENEKGIHLLQIALDTLRQNGRRADIPAAYNDLGLAYANWSRPDEACGQYAQGWRYFQENAADPGIEDELMFSDLLANWSRALVAAGRPDSALLLAREALRLDPEHPPALLMLSRLAAQSGDTGDAARLAGEASHLLQEDSPPLNRELAKALLWQAELAGKTDLPRALRHCQEALGWVLPGFTGENPTPRDFYPENTILEALDLKSTLLWQQYQQRPNPSVLQAADTATALAVQMADLLIESFGFESSQLASLLQTRSLHERFLQILFERQRLSNNAASLARLVAFSEKSRAILLRQKLASHQGMDFGSDSLVQREHGLREMLMEKKNELAYLESEQAEDTTLHQLRQQIFQLEDERNTLLGQLRDSLPRYFNRQYGQATASLRDIQASLPDDSTLLVEYFYNPVSGALYTLGITRDSVRWHRDSLSQQDLGDFLVLITRAEYGLSNEGDPGFRGQYIGLATDLYDVLLRPVVGGKPPAALIVVPDGMLGALPFDALLTAEADPVKQSFRQLPYLLRTTRTRLAASASLLLATREQASSKVGKAYLGVAAAYPEGGFFAPVLHGETCVRELAKVFGCRPLSGRSANKARFRAEAPGCQILHFYGHGRANNDFPARSYLAFSTTATAPLPRQGDSTARPGTVGVIDNSLPPEVVGDVMFAQEISLLDLSAELVILSACETGVGPAVGGEGIFSLARAFQEARCPSVAMTLWEVNDAATANMSRHFLEGVRAGLEKDELLRQAKIRQLDQGASAIPYFWSGFVLTGDARALHYREVEKEGWRRVIWWVLGGGLVLLLVFGWRRRRETLR